MAKFGNKSASLLVTGADAAAESLLAAAVVALAADAAAVPIGFGGGIAAVTPEEPAPAEGLLVGAFEFRFAGIHEEFCFLCATNGGLK